MTAEEAGSRPSVVQGWKASDSLGSAAGLHPLSPIACGLPTLIHNPPSYFERLNLAALFPTLKPLEVELGAGDGTFLTQYAGAHPERNFIGVERLLGRLRKVDRKGLRAGLANLRLVRVEAWYFAEWMLPVESVEVFHVYFPDPWPKRRHHRRRLINAKFSQAVRQALKPGGRIFFRTDNPDYHAQILEVFEPQQDFVTVDAPAELASSLTDFERDFHAQGVPTLQAGYQRKSCAAEILPPARSEG